MTDDGGDITPRPDPTRLTSDAVHAATSQWQRELRSGLDLVDTRLGAMDEATRLRLTAVDQIGPRVTEQIGHLERLHDERFRGIDLRFTERDVRTDQAAATSKQALDAALLAAKELVGQQNEANAAAAAKAELSFTKQIDQIGLRIETLEKGINDRLTEIKERIDRGEGGAAGAAGSRTERRLDVGQAVAMLALALTVLGLLVAVFVNR